MSVLSWTVYGFRCDGCGLEVRPHTCPMMSESDVETAAAGRAWQRIGDDHLCYECGQDPAKVADLKVAQAP
jgi:rubredoxin